MPEDSSLYNRSKSLHYLRWKTLGFDDVVGLPVYSFINHIEHQTTTQQQIAVGGAYFLLVIFFSSGGRPPQAVSCLRR